MSVSEWISADDRLKKLIADQLSVSEDDVVPEANFADDLNADSLDLVELIMSLEENFGLKIPDEDAKGIETVAAAYDYLHQHGDPNFVPEEKGKKTTPAVAPAAASAEAKSA
jgi:acyl carrier protein